VRCGLASRRHAPPRHPRCTCSRPGWSDECHGPRISHANPNCCRAGNTSHVADTVVEPYLRAQTQDTVLGTSASPTLNQEVVASLLEVLLTHEDAAAAVALAQRTADAAPLAAAAGSDIVAAVGAAAVHEARLTAVEWAHIAVVALQGTQVRSTQHAARPLQPLSTGPPVALPAGRGECSRALQDAR
jgi:hypothetical protein